MTTAELIARRDELQADLANAPAAKRDTAWYRDRVNALAWVDRQLATRGLVPADHAELSAHAGAWRGDRPEDGEPIAKPCGDDELWWGENGPTRFDHFDSNAN